MPATAFTQAPPARAVKMAISYYCLLSYCLPEKMPDPQLGMAFFRERLGGSAGMPAAEVLQMAIPEVCRRIVAFHQGTREPDPKTVEDLAGAARDAEKSPAALAAFQVQMAQVAALPGRAKPENRLHRSKGCALCAAPCRYGYFTLVSDPQISQLQTLLAAEAARPAAEQTPLRPVYAFALSHLSGLASEVERSLATPHLANLAFCLLLLGMAKSRLAMPAKQLQIFQAANQEFVRRALSVGA
jgi:hypothetical protein